MGGSSGPVGWVARDIGLLHAAIRAQPTTATSVFRILAMPKHLSCVRAAVKSGEYARNRSHSAGKTALK